MAVIKFGTVQEIERVKNDIPEAVYQSALKIVTILDKEYGADRDTNHSDGGFCLVATTIQDVDDINRHYIRADSGQHEYAEVIKSKGADCVHALFLTTNEHGINIYFLNRGIVPTIILDEIEG